MMLLADVSAKPDPSWFWQFVLAIGMLLSMGANFVVLLNLKRTQKREVTFGVVPASKEEFDRLVKWNEKEHDNIFGKLGGMERGMGARMDSLSKEWRDLVDRKFTEMAAASDVGREKLHERINQILGEVREMRGQIRRPSH